MAGIKRKQDVASTGAPASGKSASKKLRSSSDAATPKFKTEKHYKEGKSKHAGKTSAQEKPKKREPVSEDSDISEEEHESDEYAAAEGKFQTDRTNGVDHGQDTGKEGLNEASTTTSASSKEAHAKQRKLAKERKAAKPNADIIARSKKLWERLRLKSHVPKDERKALVTELFEIITGRVKDFVFKHDSVRVIQCALKYANPDQRKAIAEELRGEYRALAESRYAKFLIGKILVEGDSHIRSMVVSEFSGHVKRLINHPEASWILDDTYRGVMTSSQKASLLREWYGPEFALFKNANATQEAPVTADLREILQQSPEKRKPILEHLHRLINQLVQKKATGFTMLHDAMLQYYLALTPGSAEANEFLELLKSDEDHNLLHNLAFTKSGARVVALALAYSGAKDRKHILKAYKDLVEQCAFDPNASVVLLAACEVIDDTVLTGKSIFPELLGKEGNDEAQQNKILDLANHLIARSLPLFLFSGGQTKYLSVYQKGVLEEVHSIRETTSKKDSNVRRVELVKSATAPVLATIAARAPDFASTSFGCQFITEALLGSVGDKSAAVNAVAELAKGDPKEESHIAQSAAGGRMLKALAAGGRFDPEKKEVVLADPRVGFAGVLYKAIHDHLIDWATGTSSFVVVGLTESGDLDEKSKAELLRKLRRGKKELAKAAGPPAEEKGAVQGEKKSKKESNGEGRKGNVGARLLLEKL